MLYGMEESRELIVTEPKLNIKKVAVFITVILVCLSIIFVSFLLSYKSMNKDNTLAGLITDEKKDKSNKNKNAYTGKHYQIAEHSIENIKLKFIPKYNENAQQQIRDIYFSSEKDVYLTFDDGPSRDITPRVLDILKEEDIPATFFVLGSRAEVYPELLKRIHSEGHYIANHGYSHKYPIIYEKPDKVLEEYSRCEEIIKNILNNQEFNTYLFRFPGGSTGGVYANVKSQARTLLDEHHIAYTNWNCLTGDAEGIEDKEGQVQEFLRTKGQRGSLIVLMHDANDKVATPESLVEIIQHLRNEGYTFKNFYEIF